VILVAVKTSSRDLGELTDREIEHSELWSTVFASGRMQSDGPSVENKVSCCRWCYCN